MIAVEKLSRRFNRITAVDELTFTIQPGEIVGFLGPNGAGKSTTMKMLTGFLTPTEGQISIDGLSMEKHTKTLQQRIGYLPEGAPLYNDMTVFQFLHFIAGVRGLRGKQRKARLTHVIKKVALQGVLNRQIEKLSKGFRHRIGLAQAIIHDPDILILDEPTDGLDPNQKHEVRELIRALSSDKIVIISTHILEEVTAVCNRAMIIANGKLCFDGTPSELQHRSRYHQAITLHFSYAADISGLAEIEGVDEMVVNRHTGDVTLFPEAGKLIMAPVTEHVSHYRLPVDKFTIESGRLDDVFREITTGSTAEVGV
ncbi:ABC transporter ATP-binding protein [Aestuariibacter sp. A3R04]|uniref:ABC transporter ATP-binding protein n=1 Tax=Aestuariibacter sp. A3R04 TaxID=2841571 RepID=UPI001C0882D5|nr:ATP-binding cassette domain-containing protein [Aestuariibacter sp. A3R04]MBU3021835.1 ATP-binding cassette domain-containing protein [Aestuariibacter sp. A3R04]